jgi:hypothetical protein
MEQSMQMRVPFNCGDERGCNKKVKGLAPGPGTYIDINNPNNSSICKSLNKIKEDRTLAESQGVKLGAFGTTCGRFEKSWMVAKNPDVPGPGFYEDDGNITNAETSVGDTASVKGKTLGRCRTLTTAEYEKRLPNSSFRSTTDRFNLNYSSNAPNVRVLGKKNTRATTRVVMRDQDNMNLPGSGHATRSACYHSRKQEPKSQPMDIDNKVVFGVENKITYLDNEKSWT